MNRCAYLIIFISGIILLLYSPAYSQVEVTTKDDQTYTGFLIDETQEMIKIKDINKTDHTFEKSGLKKITGVSIKIRSTSGQEFSGSVRDYSDSAITIVSKGGILSTIQSEDIEAIEFSNEKGRESYPMAGITFFSPGGVNLVAGYQFAFPGGIRISGGTTFGSISGLQVNALVNIYKTKKVEQNFSIGIGYVREKSKANGSASDDEINEGGYLGIYYDINFAGLFVETGFIQHEPKLRAGFFAFQLGYVYRFNK